MPRNFQEEEYIYNFVAELVESPPHLLKAMAAAYMRKYDLPPEEMVLVRERDPRGKEYYYVTSFDEINGEGRYEEPNREGAGRDGGGRRRTAWRIALARWIGGF